ncbi:MAG: SDR family NAD(P)-dependent oxidoreductase [Candidatus Aenigmarchaeota archaeon]|nr:SDR family NAD(P)-dependent oxidoreductase [Candidatus Aenigmarchaeota archaeon]
MEVLITGGAGCIGSDLAARLLREGHQVTVFDNLSSGKEEHIQNLLNNDRLKFNKGDLLDKKQIENACKNIDVVFHLAANSDIKYRPEDPTDEDLKLNTIATYNVLEAMRLNSVKKIVFTSSSAVYGEAEIIPTPEDCGLRPISLYAASKAACEAMISGFCYMFEMEGWIFRLANIISGKSRKKGKTVLSDFIEKLSTNRKELEILGDGKQRKSYLTVNDCIDGIMLAMKEPYKQVNVLNLGPEDSITVDEIAEIVASQMGLKDVKFKHTGGDRGWPGDVPRFLLDTTKIRKLGWKPRHTSREAIEIATKSLLDQVIQ